MQKANINRFATFQEADEVVAPVVVKQQQQKKPDPSKKIVTKITKQAIVDDGQGEFAAVETNVRPQTAGGNRGRGGERGGRGGRGGDRGGRGGDRGGRGGDRGGRGGDRGGRPRTAKVEGEEGAEVERTNNRNGDQKKKYEGKAREGAHPYDRKDGTGRAHRGDRKEGNTKGSWGNERKAESGEVVEGAEESKGDKPQRERKPREDRAPRERREGGERRERRPREEEKVEEPAVEEEEIGFTLEDYMAQQQAKSTGVVMSGKVREHEKVAMKNTKLADDNRGDQFQSFAGTNVTGREMHAVKPGMGGELFGFQSAPDMVADDSRRGPRKDLPAAKPKGNRKGGKMVIDDNEFPAL